MCAVCSLPKGICDMIGEEEERNQAGVARALADSSQGGASVNVPEKSNSGSDTVSAVEEGEIESNEEIDLDLDAEHEIRPAIYVEGEFRVIDTEE